MFVLCINNCELILIKIMELPILLQIGNKSILYVIFKWVIQKK